jgi:hypothetical protein
MQNPAILRNAARIKFPLTTSEKQAAQHPENLRKKSSLNYESPALTAKATARFSYTHSTQKQFVKERLLNR